MKKSSIARRIRAHRARVEFNRVFDSADPAMRQELIAAAAHQNVVR
jgi:hypothetical protein